MRIITTISDPGNVGYQILQLSCVVNDLELTTLVTPQKFFFSTRVKDLLLKEYLENVDGDELILFTDGYDSIFLCDSKEIESKFYSFQKDVIFSTEVNCWPDKSLLNSYPANASPYKYLNSGGFIGKASDILQLLSENFNTGDNAYTESNQYLWTKKFLENQDRIGLDYNGEIFCTLFSEGDPESSQIENIGNYILLKQQWFFQNYEIKNERIYNKRTDSNPSSLHFNGITKNLMTYQIYELILSRLSSFQKVKKINYEIDFESLKFKDI